MKSKLVVFSKEDFNFIDNKTINFLLTKLYKQNIDINNIEFASRNLADLNVFSADNYDYCFVLADENIYEYAKQKLSNFINLELVENKFALNYATSYADQNNIKLTKLDKQHIQMPNGSRAIINTLSFLFGFILETNSVTYIFLPNKLLEIEPMVTESVLMYLETESKRKQYSVALKTFGLNADKIYTLLNGDETAFEKTDVKVIDNYPEATVIIRYNDLTPKVVVDSLIRMVCERLNEFIVDESDRTLSQIIMEVLDVQNKNLSIFESFTAGNIASTFATENKNAAKNIKACEIDLNIDKTQPVVDVIYNITLDLLIRSKSDIVLSVINENDNVYYIAVGDKNNIHIFKDVFNQEGLNPIDYATKSALFYLLKKLNFKDY